jgi:undecaprenyl diphosphate synthase
MDGNGRWATARGLPRAAGHKAGAAAVRRAVECAYERGVDWLTLYAFSSDNWRRPPREVATLLRLFGEFLLSEIPQCLEHGVRLTVIGRRDRLGAPLRGLIERAERETGGGTAMHLRLAIDYSARDAILRAAQGLTAGEAPTREAFARALAGSDGAPDVDLLIRTGGEQRLSDFLLWESAYAELVFLERMWPDFGACDLDLALSEFGSRERRFGSVPAQAPRTAAQGGS